MTLAIVTAYLIAAGLMLNAISLSRLPIGFLRASIVSLAWPIFGPAWAAWLVWQTIKNS